MFVKLFGVVVLLVGLYIIHIKRNQQDDSLLLGSGLILFGLLTIIVGWIAGIDFSKRGNG